MQIQREHETNAVHENSTNCLKCAFIFTISGTQNYLPGACSTTQAYSHNFIKVTVCFISTDPPLQDGNDQI